MNHLLTIIKQKGYTQESFAQEIGLTRTGLIGGIKNETLKYRDLKKISEVLKISIGNLFQRIDADNSYFENGRIDTFKKDEKELEDYKAELSKCIVELKYSREKAKTLEQLIEDKNMIIELLKNKG